MKKTHATSRHSHPERPTWSFWVWLISTFLVLLIVAVIGAASVVRHVMVYGSILFSDKQVRMIMTVAEFPSLVKAATFDMLSRFGSDPIPLLMDRNMVTQSSWVRRFPAQEDSGYLLLSGLDPIVKHSIA
jgi:heme/copper-type cytochrome/quinol oxidase subunit 1